MERLGIALLALGCAWAIALWAYGVYCYIQMVRHRTRGAQPFQVAWPPEHLTPLGREFRRRALRAYAWFAVLAVVILVVSALLSFVAGRRP